VQKADTLGIVYTPQEIVEFMVASVDEVLKREFGKSLATPGVKILDPCVGTGNFIVNIIKHIAATSRSALREKYAHDLFCNEISLLPYYIASMNIEHEYYEKMQEYTPFEGVCFVDTLELAEGQQLPLWVVEENTERIKSEKEADIMVVIGNPPYNVGQVNENDNNKNRKYSVVDQPIRETYAKASKASNKNALSDMYVKFFRWATDRLQGHDDIVCFVSNNSFVDQIAFDGMRQYLLKDFTQIYHIDLHGNVRKNPKISGTKHNVFGIQVGVGITFAVQSSKHTERTLHYYRVPEDWTKLEKLDFLKDRGDLTGVEWLQMVPDANHIWITEGLHPEFVTFLEMGSKEVKAAQSNVLEKKTLFKIYSQGIQTARDNWMYDFSKEKLSTKASIMIDTYNNELARWIRAGSPKDVDSFVLNDERKIKWSSKLKEYLTRKIEINYNQSVIRQSLYRPFCKQYLYFDKAITHRQSLFPFIFPTVANEQENRAICLTNLGAEKPFMALATNYIADYHFVGAGAVSICFPYYTYAEDGSNRRENITDWSLKQFQAKYGEDVTKWDIFHHIYAMLHHPQYRERYAENLKRDLPHIPLLARTEAYRAAVKIGQTLMDLHIYYEQQEPYPLMHQEDPSVPFGQLCIVEKMKLTPDHSAVIVNKGLTLAGIPEACFRYRLGNRSALEWIIDQYQMSKDARSGITSDPNRREDPEYIVRLVKQVVAVSVKTVELVDELAQSVTQEDWLASS
jgi:predicted helicase